MSAKSDTFRTEGYIRQRFQEPMLDMLRQGGATDIKVYEEGPNDDQFQRGDLEYQIDGSTITVDLKGDGQVYPGCTLFYETWSNYPHREGWGTKTTIDRIWYAFYPLGMIIVLDLAAWREETTAWLAEDARRERTQVKNAQHNLTKGVPCRPRMLLSWDRARRRDNLPAIIVRVCRMEGERIQAMPPTEGVDLLLRRAARPELWRAWPTA